MAANGQTKESKRLTFEGLDDPFISHGIDVIPDPEASEKEAVYILAINHVPNQAVFPRDGSSPATNPGSAPKAASRIDVFHHVLGSDTVRYNHTIAHPLIRTPNDIYAIGPREVLVSNDHYYFEGYMRIVEDVWPGATWSNVIHATLTSDGSVEANIALDHLHNPNGFGHGRTRDEILLASATGGTVRLTKLDEGGGQTLVVDDIIDLASTVDNPVWFSDPYADETTGDASGFVLGGLTRALELAKGAKSPLGREGVMVWYVTPSKEGEESGKWEKRLLWQDDGSNIRNAATAVLVGIDPKKENGKKKAWLFVTGFTSEATIAVKVDLL